MEASATPDGLVAFIRSSFNGCRGQTTIPPGAPCAGTVLPVGGAALVRIVNADFSGAAHLAGNVPNAACGHICLVALDIANCNTNNIAQF